MEKNLKVKYFFLAVGTLMVGLSGAIVGKYAFSGQAFPVFAGYFVFVVAYKICWHGVHQQSNIREMVVGEADGIFSFDENLLNYLMIAAGLYLASYGTVKFATLVENPSVKAGFLAGVACFTGYVLSHEGVNEVPL